MFADQMADSSAVAYRDVMSVRAGGAARARGAVGGEVVLAERTMCFGRRAECGKQTVKVSVECEGRRCI